MRVSSIERNTGETRIVLKLGLDGSGNYRVETGCGFLDHMLELFARHGRFDLEVACTGDVQVDYHHTAEDVAIVLGRAFADALGDCSGINRYGSMLLPMDEALVLAAVDISGRGGYHGDLGIPTERIGDFDTELVEEFFTAFTRESRITLHLRKMAGLNSHHIVEAAFKATARALCAATSEDKTAGGAIPSTKGTIL